jgi:hypothetical protein
VRLAAAYIPPYPVVDALNFSAALARVGDRVELIGRIVEVKPGARKRGKGRAQRYVFINFGSWRGNVVKISIWSDGLAKLKEQPSNAWIGRWVSVKSFWSRKHDCGRTGAGVHASAPTAATAAAARKRGDRQNRFRREFVAGCG